MRGRRLGLLVLAVVGMFVMSWFTAADASAATWSTLHRPYSYSTCAYSSPLGLAMHVKVSGDLVYERSPYTWVEGTHDYRNLHLEDPAVTSWATRSCSSATPVTYNGADLTQYWNEYTCSDSVSLQAGYPWNIGLSWTSMCGNEKRGYRKTTPRATQSHHEQYNSGSPIRFKQTYQRVPWVCADFTATAVLYKGGASDAVTRGDYRFCTPYIHN